MKSLTQQLETDTHSWALDGTVVDVINDIMRVPAVNAAAHRLGSSKDLLDRSCSGEIQLVSASAQENLKEVRELHPSPRSCSCLWGPQAGATRFTRGQQTTSASSSLLVSTDTPEVLHVPQATSCCHHQHEAGSHTSMSNTPPTQE